MPSSLHDIEDLVPGDDTSRLRKPVVVRSKRSKEDAEHGVFVSFVPGESDPRPASKLTSAWSQELTKSISKRGAVPTTTQTQSTWPGCWPRTGMQS